MKLGHAIRVSTLALLLAMILAPGCAPKPIWRATQQWCGVHPTLPIYNLKTWFEDCATLRNGQEV